MGYSTVETSLAVELQPQVKSLELKLKAKSQKLPGLPEPNERRVTEARDDVITTT